LLSFLRFSVSTKVTFALSCGLGILLVLGAFGFYSAGEFFKTGQEVRRLLQVRGNLEVVRQHIERAEAVELRYQLTGDPADRGEFPELSARIFKEIDELRSMVVAPDQKDRLDVLRRVTKARFDLLAEAMQKRSSDGAGAALLLGQRSAETGKQVQELVDAIGERQRLLAKESGERVENLVRLLLTLAFWGSVFAVTLLLWTVAVINRYERDRGRAEGDLANARERLAFALEGSRSAAWDWDLSRNEVYLSAGWQQMLGAEARETTVPPTALLDLVHPEDVGRVQAAIKGALTGVTADYREEHRVRRADGVWIWILSRGRVVLRDGKGGALRITGINQDVTERKDIELALQEHDLQLQLALATAGMVRWDWDVAADEFVWPEDPWRLVGPAPREGYSGLRDMVHPEDLVRFIRSLNQAAQTGDAYKDEYRVTRTDGTTVWVSARGYAVRDAEGKAARVIGVAQGLLERHH